MGRRVVPLLDARPRAVFLQGHAPGAAHLPLAEWDRRAAELPAKDVEFDVVADDAESAAARLRARGWTGARVADAGTRADRSEAGAAHAVLWRPSPALERHADVLPARGRALDVACGSGRHAVWLAARGLATWGFDLLPDALARARALAEGARALDPAAPLHPRAPLAFACADAGRPLPFRPRSFDIVCGFRYLDRTLFPRVADLLVPGGWLVWETFSHRAPADARPRRPAFRLGPGELRALCTAAGLSVERAFEAGPVDSALARRGQPPFRLG